MHFCKRCVVFVLIVVCALSIVNSASGISQFSSSREVKMRVADPRNAFISLPEMLEINIKILEGAINKDDISCLHNHKDRVENRKRLSE